MSDSELCSVFILSHGRPLCETARLLRRLGFDGDIHLVIDDMDDAAGEYARLNPDCIIHRFNKREWMADADGFFDPPEPGGPLYARNSIGVFARQAGKPFYLHLDDDYRQLAFRTQCLDGRLASTGSPVDLGAVFDAYCEFLADTGARCVAFPQSGDFIGASDGTMALKRKSMNSFFARVDDPIEFIGVLNDDTNTYVSGGNRGELWCTLNGAGPAIVQGITQMNEGGMTELYRRRSTFVKSAQSVMVHPTGVRLRWMGGKADKSGIDAMGRVAHPRIHHNVVSRYTYPRIVRED